jgi:hypothetical protein
MNSSRHRSSFFGGFSTRGLELKFDGFTDVQGPAQVFAVETIVLDAEVISDRAYLHQELAPGVFAVAGQQGVVQIEERQGQSYTLDEVRLTHRSGACAPHRRC